MPGEVEQLSTQPRKHPSPHALVAEWFGLFNEQLNHVLARGVRGKEDVQDLAQEVYLRLLRVDNPELIQSPWAYLYRIAVHVLAEWRARERRQQLHGPEA